MVGEGCRRRRRVAAGSGGGGEWRQRRQRRLCRRLVDPRPTARRALVIYIDHAVRYLADVAVEREVRNAVRAEVAGAQASGGAAGV